MRQKVKLMKGIIPAGIYAEKTQDYILHFVKEGLTFEHILEHIETILKLVQ